MYDKIEGIDQFDKIIDIDQLLIGRMLCFNLVIYIGVFDDICDVFV